MHLVTCKVGREQIPAIGKVAQAQTKVQKRLILAAIKIATRAEARVAAKAETKVVAAVPAKVEVRVAIRAISSPANLARVVAE
jgi:hypothetical protein